MTKGTIICYAYEIKLALLRLYIPTIEILTQKLKCNQP
jgi:hypothetical protein